MTDSKPQNFKNHIRFVPPYHLFVFLIFMLNLGGTVYHLVKDGVTFASVIGVLMAAALIVLFFYARVFALTVQDRVIRLEMRLRMAELLPSDLKPRVPELTVPQLVSLRFASDAELPSLMRKVLDDRLTKRKEIKLLIKDWQADHLRV